MNEILSEFDIENNVFEMIDVSDALGHCSDSEKTSPEYQAELMAVNLVENYTDTSDTLNGKFYFGPYIVFQDQTTGKMIEYPDRTEINSDMIKYWEKRVAETKNDILKARYSGLIWEFKFYATKQKCNIEIAQIYIQSLINIVNDENQPHPILSVHRAERAIALSVKLKQTSLRNSAKNALSDLIERNDEWDAIGIWGSAYKISTEYPNSYTKDEQRNLISDLETRFERIYEFIAANDNLQKDPWLLMDLANILAAYYQKNSHEKIEPLFDKVEHAFDIMKDSFTNMQLTEIYRRTQKSLTEYGLNGKASQLYTKIAAYGNGIQKELFKIEHNIDIPNEKIKSIVNAILQDNNIENSLLRIACYFIPNKDREKCSLERIAKEAPFIHMITQSLYDNKGRLKAMVGGINTDLEGQLVLHISMSLRLEFIFLNATIEEAKHRGFFTTENIVNDISKSPVIKKKRFLLSNEVSKPILVKII